MRINDDIEIAMASDHAAAKDSQKLVDNSDGGYCSPFIFQVSFEENVDPQPMSNIEAMENCCL